MPFAWKSLLAGLPDIGGVALASLVLILYHHRHRHHTQFAHFMMGVSLVTMMVFRRYFAFWTVGFFAAYILDQLLAHSISWKKRLLEFTWMCAGTAITLAIAGESFLLMLNRNYGQTYQAYLSLYPLYEFLHNVIFVSFGAPIVLGCCLSALALVRNKNTRRITLFLLVQSFVSVWLFTRIQSFSIHHFLLLLPLVSYLLVHGTLYIYQKMKTTRYRTLLIATVIGFQAFSFTVAFVPNTLHNSSIFDSLWPMYYPPQQRRDMTSISKICRTLATLNYSQTVYVLSSSSILNSGIVESACPQTQLLKTAEVDGRDEFPVAFFDADIVLTATPLQLHLEPKDQVLVSIIHKHFSSDLQRYYQLIEKYPLDEGVTAELYVRNHQVPPQLSTQIENEYQSSKQLKN